MLSAEPLPSLDGESLYDILEVSEDASQDEIIKAYRQRALSEHPDKGGDKDRFDELNKAYAVLSDERRRDAYDKQLEQQREHETLVEGGRSGYSKQQLQAPMARVKTAPTAGSRRQAQMRISHPGRPEHCAEEWKGMGSGKGYLKMLTDDATPEQRTQKLLEQYTSLPRGKEKKQEWTSGLRGKEKQDLKDAAKKKEQKEQAKWSAWLGNGVASAKSTNPKAKAKSKAKTKPLAKSKAAESTASPSLSDATTAAEEELVTSLNDVSIDVNPCESEASRCQA